MTDTLAPALRPNRAHVAVEASAKVLRGIAVIYDIPTLVADVDPDGGLIVTREIFDRDSIILPDRQLPLLRGHDPNEVIGKVTSMWHGVPGLELEAELIGSSSELESLREKIGHGVLAGLSIAFAHDPRKDIWTKADTKGGVPTVRRRGAMLREISLVLWPAYPGARVTALRNRTERQRWGDEILDEHRARREAEAAKRRAEADQQRAELNGWLAQERRITDRFAQLRQRPDDDARQAPIIPTPTTTMTDLVDLRLAEIGSPPTDPGPDANDDERYDYMIRSEDWMAQVREVARLIP